MLSHPPLLSHVRTLKTSNGHLARNTSKRPRTSRPIKHLCVLLQNPPEKLVSPLLCPKAGSSPGSLQIILQFAAPAGWNHAQRESRGTAHGIPPGRIQTRILFLTVSVPACTRQVNVQPRPRWKPCQLPSPSPARYLTVPHTSFLPAREIWDTNRVVCFPLRPRQCWTWNTLCQRDSTAWRCFNYHFPGLTSQWARAWRCRSSAHAVSRALTGLSHRLFFPTSSLKIWHSSR